MKNILVALSLVAFFASTTISLAGGDEKATKGKKSCCSKTAKSSCSKEAAAKKSCGDAKEATEKAS